MSSHDSPRSTSGPTLFPPGLHSRRDSLASVTASTPVDKEQLAQALDKIHSTACHSDSLTTFNEFASPPPPSSNPESKGLASDLMQNGLSGLYSRFRGVVVGGKEKSGTLLKSETEGTETASLKSSHNSATPTSKGSIAPTREDSGLTTSPIQASTTSSQLQSPTASSFIATTDSQSQAMRSSRTSFTSTPVTARSTGSTRPSIVKATPSSVIVPTVAPVNVSAFKDGDTPRTVALEPDVVDKSSKTSPYEKGQAASSAGLYGFGDHFFHRL